jgi:hypothetical protein
MTESPDELERHIHEVRRDLKSNFIELEDKVKSSLDFRAQFQERPGTFLAVAFGGGILLSGLLPRGRSRRRSFQGNGQQMNGQNVQTDRNASAYYAESNGTEYPSKPSPLSDFWSALQGAALGAVAGKLSDFMEELLPGFKAESYRVRSRRN